MKKQIQSLRERASKRSNKLAFLEGAARAPRPQARPVFGCVRIEPAVSEPGLYENRSESPAPDSPTGSNNSLIDSHLLRLRVSGDFSKTSRIDAYDGTNYLFIFTSMLENDFQSKS